ncbi:MAG: hypothetical protein IPJ52_11040 [Rhodocyclaceae bacterium]|nr:hypothetical protein [Rhodocyclaceae bacterium]
MIAENYRCAAAEQERPCVLFRPKVFIDGGSWCALYGENLQEGVAGFGASPAEATVAFDAEWHRKLPSSNVPSSGALRGFIAQRPLERSVRRNFA